MNPLPARRKIRKKNLLGYVLFIVFLLWNAGAFADQNDGVPTDNSNSSDAQNFDEAADEAVGQLNQDAPTALEENQPEELEMAGDEDVSTASMVMPVEEMEEEISSDEEAVQLASQDTTAPGNVSLDFKDADILNVLRVLSLKSNVNIVAGPEVEGTVTIRLSDVPWEKAMDVVLRTYGYVYEREGNIIRVTTKDNLSTEELVTETYVLNYTTSQEVEEAIRDVLSERGRVKSVPRANTIIVSDVPTNMYKISQVIAALDQITPQVYIDAKIVRTELNENEDLGIGWNLQGSITGGSREVTFPFTAPGNTTDFNPINNLFNDFFAGKAPFSNLDNEAVNVTDSTATEAGFTLGTLNFQSLSAALAYLRSKTNTKIVSNPRIVVLNNQTAKVQVGNEIPIPTFERNETTGSFVISGFTYRDTGVVLNVTPHINAAREILVDLKPEVSSQAADVSFGTGVFQAPSFSTTTAETQLLIKDGETIAIGGLMRDLEKYEEDSVPGLSKIPLIGRLFRNSTKPAGSDANQKIETLFFITISIVDTAGQRTMVQPMRRNTTIVPAQTAVNTVGIQQNPV
ncbi:MAG: hypothetical protein COV74_01625 [Candidatus Omnitrophica bacterium CG11_big_fil_rev_8_21_14_0_20_45_26]|uniref:Secretin/TonB short N-terminal domain-containing protein n=1 Tax=Candidatus Abzuiibacterium crystallinum TaxID=1974748 RepID=A0A2H0LSB7_9BACT|nr:MAG: hypothetical protein COV74_01625 [Candidatus Omnitrophica bacterium CG11_big_fil_rev_8_21_14_0_20_45_26]PIW64996.1 MAG: hypothetical protein COW12_03905 [Candidatus Omnitrophica bacterium CG12_big_fil_rev_8_21_14_0_65_45_16]